LMAIVGENEVPLKASGILGGIWMLDVYVLH
jgi:hypothetical protein